MLSPQSCKKELNIDTTLKIRGLTTEQLTFASKGQQGSSSAFQVTAWNLLVLHSVQVQV